MCGIAGIINAQILTGSTPSVAFLRDSKEWLADALIATGVRGLDSTGIFQTDKKLQPYYHRLPVSGALFAEDRTTKAFLNDVNSSLYTVAHLRAATTGKVSLNNTHPFYCKRAAKDAGYIIGVHNGTLTGWSSLQGASKYSVDSEWALAEIAAEGVEAFKKFTGSFSFVWMDSESPEKLYFARNAERPMCFARTQDKKHMLFASEAGMIAWLADRRKISIEKDMYESEPGFLYSVNTASKELEWTREAALPVKSVVVHTSTSNSSGSYSRSMLDDESDWENWYVRGSRTSSWDPAAYRTRYVEEIKAMTPVAANEEVDEITEQTDVSTPKDADIMGGQFVQRADPSWFSDSSVTRAERRRANKKGWYGEIVEFRADAYEKDTCLTYGVILEHDASSAEPMEYESVVRGLKTEQFEKWKGRVNYGVIVGCPTREDVDEDFIIAPLNDKGEAGIIALLDV